MGVQIRYFSLNIDWEKHKVAVNGYFVFVVPCKNWGGSPTRILENLIWSWVRCSRSGLLVQIRRSLYIIGTTSIIIIIIIVVVIIISIIQWRNLQGLSSLFYFVLKNGYSKSDRLLQQIHVELDLLDNLVGKPRILVLVKINHRRGILADK